MNRNKIPFPIILASASPRRKQLMEEAGYHFTTRVFDTDETIDPTWDPFKTPEYLAQKKARAALAQIKPKEDCLIIAADTIVIKDNQPLGKPENVEHAAEMLRSLSNTVHQVVTGVAFEGTHQFTFNDITDVYMDHLSEKEIKHYIDHYLPLDKAGAYGIQQWIGHNKIKKIVGSYTNVMGLPMHKLYQAIELFT